MKFFKTLKGDEEMDVRRLARKSRRKGQGRHFWVEMEKGEPRKLCWYDWNRQQVILAESKAPIWALPGGPMDKTPAHDCTKLAERPGSQPNAWRPVSLKDRNRFVGHSVV